MSKPIKALLITNIPVPYRERIHEIVASDKDIDYTVFYCARIEPNRQWKIQYGNYQKELLEEQSLSFYGSRVYFGTHIILKLKHLNPDAIILGGLSPTMLYAYFWAKMYRKQCIFFSDSNLDDEKKLSVAHKILRHALYSRCKVFVGASKKTKDLFSQYSTKINFFQSHLCADNNYFKNHIKQLQNREYDFIFSGQIIDRKMPYFFVDVIRRIQEDRAVKVLIIGDGPSRDSFIDALNSTGAMVDYKGFVDQKLLPEHYTSAKILLFPSKSDAWGLVANEALASGTPVLVSHKVGAADELVVSNLNGYVLPNDAELWAHHALNLLNDINLWNKMSTAAVQSVAEYSYENAADGIIKAIRYAADLPKTLSQQCS